MIINTPPSASWRRSIDPTAISALYCQRGKAGLGKVLRARKLSSHLPKLVWDAKSLPWPWVLVGATLSSMKLGCAGLWAALCWFNWEVTATQLTVG